MKNLATTKISVLDLAKVSQGHTIAETFARSKELAQHVEKLGYTRFWLAEHHNIEGISSAMLGLLITGGPEKVRADLDQLIQETGADELIITSDTYESHDRLNSYEFISKAKQL